MFTEYDEGAIDEVESGRDLYIKWTAEYKFACSKLYKKHNIPKAFELFHAEAKRGNILAVFDIGKMYRNGLLGEENIPKSDEYFVKALQGLLRLNRPQSGLKIMCSTELEKCLHSAMVRNRTTQKHSHG